MPKHYIAGHIAHECIVYDLCDSPVPVLNLTPPKQCVLSVCLSHTVISRQMCVRSAEWMPSYTMVWLNTAEADRLTTRVLWPLDWLSSGNTQLSTQKKGHDWAAVVRPYGQVGQCHLKIHPL